MAQTTVRLRETAHEKLRALAEVEKRPMSDVLDEAIEAYRRARFLSGVNAGYAELRRDQQAAGVFQDELASLEGTLLDGLPPEASPDVAAARPRRKTSKR